jgi:hypothetical protein
MAEEKKFKALFEVFSVETTVNGKLNEEGLEQRTKEVHSQRTKETIENVFTKYEPAGQTWTVRVNPTLV